MTWLLQPADTHVFRMFKLAVKSRWVKHRSESVCFNVPAEDWLKIISDSIQDVFASNSWRHAFNQVGLLASQTGLSASVKRTLGLSQPVHVPANRPSDAELQTLFPRRVRVSALSLFPAGVDAAAKAKAKCKPKAKSKSPAAATAPEALAVGPISAHTRSKVQV